jgi:hypothetical protein
MAQRCFDLQPDADHEERTLAGSGSYARGDQPRSVPDKLKAAEEAAARKQKAYNAKQEEAWYRKHPGVAESVVPVWGSGREAVADALEGDVVGAVVNTGLALSDLAPGAYALKAGAKGAVKLAGSHTWNATRKWMGKNGLLEAGQHGHHGIIPRNGWGKIVPDGIKNQPWNITATRNVEDHMRIHGPYRGQPQYGQVERYWRGSPDWAKRAHVWAPTGAATAVDSANERKR